MKEQQYQELCDITDEVLLASDATPARVAIPWLHIVREHPVFLEQYEHLFIPYRWFQYHLKSQMHLFRNILSIVKVILKAVIRRHANNRAGIIKKIPQADVLFISHLLNPKQYKDEDDFYFSNLPEKLADDGYRSLTALINHFGVSSNQYSLKQEKLRSKMVLSDTMGVRQELLNIGKLWKESRSLKRAAKAELDPFKKKVLCWAAVEAVSPSSLNTIRLFQQIRKIVVSTKPNLMIATHEGHAWERIAFHGARSANPEVQCLGYTHAPLFRLQHAVKRCLAKEYNPDKIFTSGYIQKNQLDKSESLNNVPIEILGSGKCFNESSISNEPMRKSLNNSYHQQTCLVIPEGIRSETELMFRFSLECATQNPNIMFIWRLHPILSFEAIITNNSELKTLPENIKVSENKLVDDLKQSQWALYRGSSTIIQAIIYGLKPLYLTIPDELNIDPLYEMNSWKSQIETPNDFINVLNLNKDEEKEKNIALNYCLDFYTLLDHKTIIETIRVLTK